MLLRRSGLVALAAMAACNASVPKNQAPGEVDYAVFDPQNSQLPQPNDLILTQDVDQPPLSGLPAAQRDLLREFQKAGGFPNDQEVAITIDFTSAVVGATGLVSNQGPDLDLSTVVPGQTVVVFGTSSSAGVGAATLEPIKPGDYVKKSDRGTLTLHNKNHQRWAAGTRYVVGVRGGPNGVKLTNGNPIYPQPTTFLLIQGKDLTLPENQALIQLQLGSRAAAAAAAAQLEGIRRGYLEPFKAIDANAFDHRELALIQTFQIAPQKSAQVEIDPSAGLAPLPSNFLLDPATGGKTVANIPAFGAAAAGIATLDGFSTTALIIAGTTQDLPNGVSTKIPIDASTVRSFIVRGEPVTVGLFDLSTPSAPQLVLDYEAEPAFIAQTAAGTGCSPHTTTFGSGTCLSTIIGLQPGAPAAINGLASKPLKEGTNYAVVITDRVLDYQQRPLSRSTISKLLLFTDPLINASGASNLTGVPDGQAQALEQMRQQLAPVIDKASTGLLSVSRDHIATAYVFRTQTITPTGLKLAALPYQKKADNTDVYPGIPVCSNGAPPSSTGCPGGATVTTSLTPASAFAKYGVDPAVVPNGNILEVIETQFYTFNLLDPATGAFRPDPAACATIAGNCLELVRATITLPNPANVTTACPAPASALKCAPLVVYRHGFQGGRGSLLTVADAFAAQGMIVVAIDAAKHGERSYCKADAECSGGKTCVADPALAGQGDAPGPTPGTCGGTGLGKNYAYRPVNCRGAGCAGFDPAAGGIPVASGDFLISANFFRVRDTFRQDIIDQSMLVRVMSPPAGAVAGHGVQAELMSKGLFIDGTRVWFIGQSLGAINGVMDVAANPRISKAVLNVGGATIVDVFTLSPSFQALLGQLLGALHIAPGSADFLKFISVGKWILDPADPINWASHLKASPLPNLLLGGTQPAKATLGQRAECDQTVPDVTNLFLYNNIGLGPLSQTTATSTVFTTDPASLSPAACTAGASSPGAVDHGFLTSFKFPTITAKAQAQAASFLSAGTLPPPVVLP